jgi:DNA-binding NtrC family response regulator
MAAGGAASTAIGRNRSASTGTADNPPRAVSVLHTSTNGRMRPGITERLRQLGNTVVVAPTVSDALNGLASRAADVCVVDLTSERALPGSLLLLRSRHPELAIVCLVNPAEPLVAGETVQAGIADVLPWPCDDRELALALANASERAPWSHGQADGADGHDPLFAQSAAMREVVEQAGLVALTRGGVIVCGEPGTGRALIARTIHAWSAGGPARPFVQFDGGEDDPHVVEQRLFGVPLDRAPASRSTASSVRVGPSGAVLAARGGTLYLTDVPNLSARVQAGLARLLRDREALLDSSGELIDVDVRPVAALEPGVDSAVADGRLREDLFERLSQARVDLAPLRRRREDVPALAAWLLDRACRQASMPPKLFSRSALALLAALPWHGNAAELRALIESLTQSGGRPVVQLDDLLEHTSLDGLSARIEAGVTLKDARARFERDCIAAVLRRHRGRVGEAAKALGIQRTNLYRKVRQLNVPRSLLTNRK